MGFGGTGGNHHAVEPLLGDDVFYQFLGILGATEQIAAGVNHMGKGFGIGFHIFDIHHAGDVNTAVADENPDSRFLIGHIDFSRHFHAFGKGVAGFGQRCSGQIGGGAGFHNRTGDVLGTLEHAAGIYARSRGFYGSERMGYRKIVVSEFDVQTPGQIGNRCGYLQAH